MSEKDANNHDIENAGGDGPAAGAVEGPAPGLIGPTFGAAGSNERPAALPACATCPKAMWYRTARQGLRAFCRELRLISWRQGEDDPVTACDGREAALRDP